MVLPTVLAFSCFMGENLSFRLAKRSWDSFILIAVSMSVSCP
jgi:hypothetical protein